MQYLPPSNMSPIRPETGRGRLTLAVLLLGLAALGVYTAWSLKQQAQEKERAVQVQREEARKQSMARRERAASTSTPARPEATGSAPATGNPELEQTIDDLLIGLQSDDEKTRRNAKITLTALGVEAIPYLTDVAEQAAESDPELRQEIISILRSIIAAHRREIESD